MTIDKAALDEAINTIRCVIPDNKEVTEIMARGVILQEAIAALETLIQAAQECKSATEAFELTKRLWLKVMDENINLRAEIDSLKKRLPVVVTVDNVSDTIEDSLEPIDKYDVPFRAYQLARRCAEQIVKKYPNGIVIKE